MISSSGFEGTIFQLANSTFRHLKYYRYFEVITETKLRKYLQVHEVFMLVQLYFEEDLPGTWQYDRTNFFKFFRSSWKKLVPVPVSGYRESRELLAEQSGVTCALNYFSAKFKFKPVLLIVILQDCIIILNCSRVPSQK